MPIFALDIRLVLLALGIHLCVRAVKRYRIEMKMQRLKLIDSQIYDRLNSKARDLEDIKRQLQAVDQMLRRHDGKLDQNIDRLKALYHERWNCSPIGQHIAVPTKRTSLKSSTRHGFSPSWYRIIAVDANNSHDYRQRAPNDGHGDVGQRAAIPTKRRTMKSSTRHGFSPRWYKIIGLKADSLRQGAAGDGNTGVAQ